MTLDDFDFCEFDDKTLPHEKSASGQMGFLKRIFHNVFKDNQPAEAPAERLSNLDVEAHLNIKRYGDFQLTDAIRPSFDLSVVPAVGYRHDVYHDAESNVDVPVIMAAASQENLFDLFVDLLEPLGTEVDVVLETSHARSEEGHTDLYREQIDRPVLESMMFDHEDLLTNDGCTGIAVLNPRIPCEVQFDEHKLLIIYGEDLKPFEAILARHEIPCNESIKFITEAEHVHASNDRFNSEFDEFKTRLGMDSDGSLLC